MAAICVFGPLCFFKRQILPRPKPYFPVFLRNVRYHAACTYNELWPCQIVRFWVPCKNTRLAYEAPWGSLRFKKQTMFCYVSKYLIKVLCQQFTYTSTIHVQIFAILCDFRSLLSSYSGQHLPWPILLAFPSLLNLFYPLLIFTIPM